MRRSENMSSKQAGVPAVMSPFGLFAPALEYMVDAAQRTVLFWDVMRQRGNQYREHLAQTAPHVLEYEVELIIDGRTLERPVSPLARFRTSFLGRQHRCWRRRHSSRPWRRSTHGEASRGSALSATRGKPGDREEPRRFRDHFTRAASAVAICDAKQCWHHKHLPCHSSAADPGTRYENAPPSPAHNQKLAPQPD